MKKRTQNEAFTFGYVTILRFFHLVVTVFTALITRLAPKIHFRKCEKSENEFMMLKKIDGGRRKMHKYKY